MSQLATLDFLPETSSHYQLFQTLVGVVASRHKSYLEKQNTTIEACYTLTLPEGTARFTVNRSVPKDMAEELLMCFKKSFH